MDSFTEITYSMLEYNLMHLRQVIFEVTDACNLQCKYCAYSDLYEGYDTRKILNFLFIRAKLIDIYIIFGVEVLCRESVFCYLYFL